MILDVKFSCIFSENPRMNRFCTIATTCYIPQYLKLLPILTLESGNLVRPGTPTSAPVDAARGRSTRRFGVFDAENCYKKSVLFILLIYIYIHIYIYLNADILSIWICIARYCDDLYKVLWILQDVRSASIMTCLFCFFAIVSFRFNFSLRYWFHGTRSWFSNICLTSHHVWVLLESHKPVSSALHRVGATGAMVRGYRGLDHGIMGHGVVGHLDFQTSSSRAMTAMMFVMFVMFVAHTKRVGFLQLECTEAKCWSSQVQWQQPTDAPRWHSVL